MLLGLSLGVSLRQFDGGAEIDGGIEKLGASMRSTDRLTDKAVQAFLKKVRAGTAPTKKLADGGGLFVTTTPAGTAVWRIKFRLVGREQTYAAGVYPEVSLAQARAERDTVRSLLKEGRDPTKARMVSRAANAVASDTTFTGAMEDWLALRKQRWSEVHFLKSRQALERDVVPYIGALPIAEVTAPMVAAVIERIVKRGANETAGKVLWNVRRIFAFAQTKAGALVRENPAVPAQEVLLQSKPHAPRPALLDFASLGELLRAAEMAPLSPAVRQAHRLVAFTAARIGNAVAAQWSEFTLDGDAPCWTVPRSQMKMQDGRPHDHKMLLGPTIVHELLTWRQMTGGCGYLFPPLRGEKPHITREALEKSYRATLKMDGKHSVHGWRASFATLAKDAGFSRDVVELALDHIHDNEVVRAYDRGERLVERRKLVYWWDSQLTAAQHGGDVLPIGRKAAGQ